MVTPFIKEHSECFLSYADNFQLRVSVNPNDAAAIESINTRLLGINNRMSNYYLNEDKLKSCKSSKAEVISLGVDQIKCKNISS